MGKANRIANRLERIRLPRFLLFHWTNLFICFLSIGLWISTSQAAIQFDVFLGYDGVIREGNYFPVVVEVANDGPSFQATFEISSGSFGAGQVRRYSTELTTNTRKRFVVPVFASNRYSTWNARLLDQNGKVRAESPSLGVNKSVNQYSFLIGAIPKTISGMPQFPEKVDTRGNKPDAQFKVCHFRPELFPDNAISLEGLNAIYLNSLKALDLKIPQVQAILKYVQQGGHLILAVEQTSDINSTPWLKKLVPCTYDNTANISIQSELKNWIRNHFLPSEDASISETRSSGINPSMAKKYGITIPQQLAQGLGSMPGWNALENDPGFKSDSVAICTGQNLDGKVMLAVGNQPLILSASRGRGQVTVLNFNPEREPIATWKNRNWFWAAVAQVPLKSLLPTENQYYGGWSIDSVIGAMIDSKQIRKLPITWLLVLLVVYLAVIGPIDQYVLKKLNRQMWTWITFPMYVVFFSGLIYLIGYKLRAGETELNQLHLVDVFSQGEKAELRGRTFLSIYSPANAKFKLADKSALSTFRGESLGFSSGAQESSKAEVNHLTQGFNAEVFVPVWTSQLFVDDWWVSGSSPISAVAARTSNGLNLVVTNHLNRPLSQVRAVFQGYLADLGNLSSKEVKVFKVNLQQCRNLSSILQEECAHFQQAVSERNRAFGGQEHNRQWDMPSTTFNVSFLSMTQREINSPQWNFVSPNGFDLGAIEKQGFVILTAWDAGNSFAPLQPQFQPKRSQKDTLLRLIVPLESTINN